MPEKYKKLKTKPRGVSNRNAALQWVRQNRKSGVLYFADDDNTYDIQLFEEVIDSFPSEKKKTERKTESKKERKRIAV